MPWFYLSAFWYVACLPVLAVLFTCVAMWRVHRMNVYNNLKLELKLIHQDTRSCVSGQEKPCDAQVCHLQEPLTHRFSAPRISITTGPISIKFTYFMPFIYATLHTKFERNQSSSLRDVCSWKLPYFLHLFLLLLRTVLQK